MVNQNNGLESLLTGYTQVEIVAEVDLNAHKVEENIYWFEHTESYFDILVE